MSLWWNVTIKTPQGNEDSTLVMGKTAEEAHENAVGEFSRTHSHIRVIGVELYADDENDQLVEGSFDREGPLPRPQNPSSSGTARLTT